MRMTFKEITAANGGEPVEFKVAVPTKGVRLIDEEGEPYVTDGGGTLTASCWTDDPDVMDAPAVFDVDASWQLDGGIGRYDNQHDELLPQIEKLIEQIAAKFGGDWYYSDADCLIEQR